MKRTLSALLSLLVLSGVVFLAFSSELRGDLSDMLREHSILGAGAFVLLLVTATVCMPFSALPLIPLASMTFGPLAAGALCLVGWSFGAGAAFLIARHLGRPIISRLISLEKIDRVSARFDNRTTFLGIVILRLALPIDFVSYALGLVRGVHFPIFMAGTVVGAAWFSFSFAYLGAAILTWNIRALVILGTISTFLFLFSWYMLAKHT